jgi:hypothetical protein
MLKLSVARRCGLKRKSETQGAPLRRLAVNPIEQVFAKLKHLLRKAVTLADRKCRGFEAPNPHGGILVHADPAVLKARRTPSLRQSCPPRQVAF